MYDSREFSAMPILADALQDAGCNSADILNHYRGDKLGKGSEKEYTETIKTITDKEMVQEKKIDDKTQTAEFTRVK
jgi:hypothetical protein